MLLASSGRACFACTLTKQNRGLYANPAVSGPIPEQLSALSLLTYLYSPSFCSQTAANAGIERGKGGLGLLCPISLQLLRGDRACGWVLVRCIWCLSVNGVQEPVGHEPERHDSAAAVAPQGASDPVGTPSFVRSDDAMQLASFGEGMLCTRFTNTKTKQGPGCKPSCEWPDP